MAVLFVVSQSALPFAAGYLHASSRRPRKLLQEVDEIPAGELPTSDANVELLIILSVGLGLLGVTLASELSPLYEQVGAILKQFQALLWFTFDTHNLFGSAFLWGIFAGIFARYTEL